MTRDLSNEDKNFLCYAYVVSSLPKSTGIVGPPHIETASDPATEIISAQDTEITEIENIRTKAHDRTHVFGALPSSNSNYLVVSHQP